MAKACDRRPMGRPTVYSDTGLVALGIGLHPTQRERLQAYAAARGISVSMILRDLVSQWEQQQGFEEPAAGQGVLPLGV